MRLITTLTLLFLAACGNNESMPNASDKLSQRASPDDDSDGVTVAEGDCDDTDASVHPGATEICADEADNDCDCDGDTNSDGVVCGVGDIGVDYLDKNVTTQWYCVDGDNDEACADYNGDDTIDEYDSIDFCDPSQLEVVAWATGGDPSKVSTVFAKLSDVDETPDCDDDNDDAYPGATEVCDGADNDCDGMSDAAEGLTTTFYADSDGDTYGDSLTSTEACSPSTGWVTDDTDCDDESVTVFPGAPEACDGVDNDCDFVTDEDATTTFYYDMDLDGQGNSSDTITSCEMPPGYVASSTDCNDADASIYLGASETCANDGVDNDCDGSIIDTPIDRTTRYYDLDADGYGDAGDSFTSCTASTGYVDNDDDCDDTDFDVNPGITTDAACDGVDNDCDGTTDEDSAEWSMQMDSNNGQPSSFTATVADDASLSGEWYPAGVSGVTVTATHLGSLEWRTVVMMDLCMTTNVIIDVEFPDGTSLGDGASAATHGDQDGDTFTFTRGDFDTTDADNEAKITP